MSISLNWSRGQQLRWCAIVSLGSWVVALVVWFVETLIATGGIDGGTVSLYFVPPLFAQPILLGAALFVALNLARTRTNSTDRASRALTALLLSFLSWIVCGALVLDPVGPLLGMVFFVVTGYFGLVYGFAALVEVNTAMWW